MLAVSGTNTSPEMGMPKNSILLNCFGRGGSSLLWNAIGSSPAVLLPEKEWHQGVFGDQHLFRKAMSHLANFSEIGWIPGVHGMCHRGMRAAIPEKEFLDKPSASFVVIKLMDRQLAFREIIKRNFSLTREIVLTRHPIPMCEGLMRSGHSVESAAKWYRSATRHMLAALRDCAALAVSFESLVENPKEVLKKTYGWLGIPTPRDECVQVKEKGYGAARSSDADMATGRFIRVPLDRLSEMFDSTVNQKAAGRLSGFQREALWALTGSLASELGYTREV
ncbi:hypothetical protein EWI61_06585 [Methylolobus aquaticus]|nr:hypothetical protein EWI61_06585 [Methylolobus aquaticus]